MIFKFCFCKLRVLGDFPLTSDFGVQILNLYTINLCLRPLNCKQLKQGVKPPEKSRNQNAYLEVSVNNILKNERMYLRVSEKEKKQITKYAQDAGLSRNEFILKCIRNKKVISIDGMDDVLRQLIKIGVNINQIAGKANSISYISKDEVAKTKKLMAMCFKLIENFIDKANATIESEVDRQPTEEEKMTIIINKLERLEKQIIGSD